MLEREDRRDLHWRQPWTSDSLALGSEMKTRNHPIGRATDICPWSGCFYCWFVKTGTIYCQCGQGFFPATKGIKARTFSRPFGSIPCVASSATTWVNLPNVGGQPTRMYQVRQWACNRHFGYGWTSALQYRLKSSTRVTLLSLSGTIKLLLDYGGKEGASSSFYQFVSESSELWKQEFWHSVCGTSMSGNCYIIAEQYWEVCGTSFNGICYIMAE